MVAVLIIHIILAVICIPMMLGSTILKYLTKTEWAQKLAKFSSYSLMGLLATGTYLVIAYHTSLVGACYAGLAYVAFFAISFVTYKKLSIAKIKKD